MSALLLQTLQCCDGKEPRLWNCPKSSCHEAFLDIRNPLEPSRVKNSPFLRGTGGVVLLSSRVWKDVNGWALEIGISCTYSNPVVTGGQKHTHIELYLLWKRSYYESICNGKFGRSFLRCHLWLHSSVTDRTGGITIRIFP